MSILGIVAHFTTSQGERLNLVIALKELQTSHTGENLAEIVFNVIQE
jgi:hypothetical protein